jgi:hypothetical protein
VYTRTATSCSAGASAPVLLTSPEPLPAQGDNKSSWSIQGTPAAHPSDTISVWQLLSKQPLDAVKWAIEVVLTLVGAGLLVLAVIAGLYLYRRQYEDDK